MKCIRFCIGYSILLLCQASSIFSQSLIFARDTAILESCDKIPPAIDSHWIYNTTDHGIALRWQRVQHQVPEESFYLMIFNGTQYFDFTSKGVQFLDANDSTNIIFEFWHEDLVPGDSVIIRIKVYDETDSINTVHYQTVIQYCPLQTSLEETEIEPLLLAYPNPVVNEMTIKIPDHIDGTSVILYSAIGEVVKQWPINGHQITLTRDSIPEGLYFAGIISKGYVVGITKIVLTQ